MIPRGKSFWKYDSGWDRPVPAQTPVLAGWKRQLSRLMDAFSYGCEGSGGHATTRECIQAFLSFPNDERVLTVTSCGNDLYFGTSTGHIAHYQQLLKTALPCLIRKIPCPGNIRRLLVLAGCQILLAVVNDQCRIYSTLALPQGPLKAIKGVVDVLPVPNSQPEQVLLVRKSLLKFLRFLESKAFTVHELPYSGSISALALSTPGYCIIANEHSYDLIDCVNHRKIALFDHGQAPQMVSFSCGDKHQETLSYEYLLTIQPDLKSKMAMFVDEMGNATRGTLLWTDDGALNSGISIQWPHVYTIFENDKGYLLVVTSLISLEKVASFDLNQLVKSASKSNDLSRQSANNTSEVASPENAGSLNLESGAPHNTATSSLTLLDPQITGQHFEGKHPEDDGANKFHVCAIESCTVSSGMPALDTINLITKKKIPSETRLFNHGNVLIFSENKTWLVYPENDFVSLLQQFETRPLSELNELATRLSSQISSYNGDQLSFCIQLLSLIEMHLGRLAEAVSHLLQTRHQKLLVSPDVAHYLMLRSPTSPLDIFQGIYDACNCLDTPPPRIIADYFEKSMEMLTTGLDMDQVRLLAYNSLRNDALIKFAKKDPYWHIMNPINLQIVEVLQKKRETSTLFKVYQTLSDNKDAESSIVEKFCELAVNLISMGDISAPAADVVLNRLDRVEDERVYSRVLFQMFELAESETIAYLKTRPAHSCKFKNVHHDLMLRISDTCAPTDAIYQMKIEYVEAQLKVDESVCRELLVQVFDFARHLYNEECAANFEILQASFSIENSLLQDVWPKVTWPDFLQLAGPHSECWDFVQQYLKVYELCLVIGSEAVPITTLPFAYIDLVVNQSSVISGLLHHSDFSCAEYFATHGSVPPPKKPYYPGLAPQVAHRLETEKRMQLKTIFFFYLEQYRLDPVSIGALKHFILAFGTTNFTASSIISMLPPDLPLIHAESFIRLALVRANGELHAQASQKGVLRANFKSAQRVRRSLDAG